jgi:hypothetical protein
MLGIWKEFKMKELIQLLNRDEEVYTKKTTKLVDINNMTLHEAYEYYADGEGIGLTYHNGILLGIKDKKGVLESSFYSN